MSPNRDWFQDFEEYDRETVFMGNSNACRVKGRGNITLRLCGGKLIKLTHVRYILELKRNLISLGTLDEEECCYRAKNGWLNVYGNQNLILKREKKEWVIHPMWRILF